MTSYRVAGMTCDGCAKAVTRAIESAAPSARVTVDRSAGRIDIDGAIAETTLRQAIEDAGFTFSGRA